VYTQKKRETAKLISKCRFWTTSVLNTSKNSSRPWLYIST